MTCMGGPYTLRPACGQGATSEENAAVLESINASGKTFLIHTVLGGRYTMRMALGGAQTQVPRPL